MQAMDLECTINGISKIGAEYQSFQCYVVGESGSQG
jgi:hypothetical protein